jgi:SAM-dependent methyltransferase
MAAIESADHTSLMKPNLPDIVDYYSARAEEYEQVYAKPERQEDIRRLTDVIPEYFAGRHVLEIACGTGYWTRRVAPRAASVTACDLSPDVLALASARQAETPLVHFMRADAFVLDGIAGTFDAAFAGFWISHVHRQDVQRFLAGLHRRLASGSIVLLTDNRYVEGSNWPVTRTDVDGNTYQRRRLLDGTEYEVLKNFPSPAEVRNAIEESGGTKLAVRELTYYWYATYEVGSVA